MSTQQSTIDIILDQLSSVRSVRARKMFGEYALYCDEKVVALICDDHIYMKYTDAGKQFAAGKFMEGYAYPGAKPSMRLNEDMIDDGNFLCDLVQITADSLPLGRR